MVIAHNLQASNSLRQLNINTDKQSKSTEKLSSGLRINRAADDAAGLSISEKMRGQISGLNQASTNAQDGISLIQTAEGALDETHSILQRMRELAVKGANETLEAEDSAAIQAEIEQLSEEIDRISTDTQFNKKQIIGDSKDGKNKLTDSLQLQVGANQGQTMEIQLTKMDATTLGVNIAESALEEGSTVEEEKVTFDDTTKTTLDTKVNEEGSYDELVAELETADDARATDIKDELDARMDAASLSDAQKAALEGYTSLEEADGSTVSKITTADKEVDLTSVDTASAGAGAEVQGNWNDLVGKLSTETDATKLAAIEAELTARFDAASADAQALLKDDAGEYITKAADTATVAGDVSYEKAVGIDVSTTAGASSAITTIDKAIEKVSAFRSNLGAYQNRLEHTIKNLDNASENLQTAESRIRDTDMAEEMMKYTSANVLSQAAQSMLAQANQAPSQVLSLLQ